MEKQIALLYARTGEFKYLTTKTERFIGWALRQVEKPYVACSFGKDSAVMLHMILKQRPDIKVRFIRWKNETELIDNFDEIIGQWGIMNLDQIEFSRENLSDKRTDRYDTDEYDSYFIGLRESESTARRITLKANGRFYKNKAGLVRISPLSQWKDNHIAAYVFSNELPILNSYLKHGIKSRTASRIPRADYGIRNAFLLNLKQRDANAYNKLLTIFPDARYFT